MRALSLRGSDIAIVVVLGTVAGLIGVFVAESIGWVGLAVPLVLLVLSIPKASVVVGVLAESLFLLVLVVSPDALPVVSLGSSVLIVAGGGAILFRSAAARQRLARWAVPLAFLLFLGAIVGLANMSGAQVFAGIRLVFVPILVGIVAAGFTQSQVLVVLRVAGLLVAVSNVAALFEMQIGVGGLQALGLEYGESVRTVDSVLRPPGLFVASYVYGGFAAVTAVLMVSLVIREGVRKLGIVWCILTASAVAGVVLSTSRFALVILVLGIVTALTLGGHVLSVGARALALGVAGAIAWAFLSLGPTSTESWDDRLRVWATAIREVTLPFGAGWGSAGAATLSQYAGSPNIVDSYYLSLLTQIGLLAVAVFVVALVVVVRTIRTAGANDSVRWAGACAAVGVMGSFVLTESWEYTGAASLLMLAMGAAPNKQPAQIFDSQQVADSVARRASARAVTSRNAGGVARW